MENREWSSMRASPCNSLFPIPDSRFCRLRQDDNIVSNAICRPQPEHGLGRQPLLFDDALEHAACVAIQLAGLGADDFVAENRRELAGQLPCLEERRPVDEFDQLLQRVVVENVDAWLAWGRWSVGVPIAVEALRTGFFERHQALGIAAVTVACADFRVIGIVGGNEGLAQVARDQRLRHAHGTRGVLHPHGGRGVVRVDLQRGVRARGRCAADQQRNVKALPLHLARHMRHFFQRWRDEAGQPDQIRVFFASAIQDHLRRDHHAQIHHIEVVAGQHHADDVLADVVYVALDGCHDDLAVGLADIAGAQFFRFDEGQQIGHRLFHHTRGLDHLRQKHLAGAEQIAHHVHAVHQRAFDHVQRARGMLARFFGVGFHECVDAVHQRMRQARAYRLVTPGQVFDFRRALGALVALGDFQQTFGAVAASVEDHVLHAFAQFRIQLVVDRHAAGIDDAHVHAGLDRMEQEHRVDCLAYGFVAAEGERDVGNAAGHMAVRQRVLDDAGGFDEVHRVVVVLFDAGGHGKDVRVEDDVFRRKANLLGQ